MQNGFIESFNGRMRDELLNETLFFDLDDARAKIAVWVADYNLRRPHSSLKYLTPAAYAAYRNGRSAAQPRPAPPIVRCSTSATRRTNLRDSNRCWMKTQWQATVSPSHTSCSIKNLTRCLRNRGQHGDVLQIAINQRISDELSRHRRVHRPANHPPREEIDDGGHIEPALCCPHIRASTPRCSLRDVL